MGNLHDRQPTRGIQNIVPTKIEQVAYDGSTKTYKKVTIDALSHYATNDVDKSSSILFYEGLEDAEGSWQIVKTTLNGNITSMRFATVLNNSSYSSYTNAWTDRESLVYGFYSQAF
jgi:hypothetical protein